MQSIITVFYSYQVVNIQDPRLILSFGHGRLTQDVAFRRFNFDSSAEAIKEDISRDRANNKLEPIDWSVWKFHLLAFNQMPG